MTLLQYINAMAKLPEPYLAADLDHVRTMTFARRIVVCHPELEPVWYDQDRDREEWAALKTAWSVFLGAR